MSVVKLSPYNWKEIEETSYESVTPGAYLAGTFTGPVLSIQFDLSAITGTAETWPIIKYRVDGDSYSEAQLEENKREMLLFSGLSAGSHSFDLHIVGNHAYGDRWTTPETSVKITGFRIGHGHTLSATTQLSTYMLIYGDSVTEGAWAEAALVSSTNEYAGSQHAPLAYGVLVADDFEAEYGIVGYGGQGWDAAGVGSMPAFSTTWDDYWLNASRLTDGTFTPAPDYILLNHGINDSGGDVTATVETMLGNLRSAAPNAKICVIIPFINTQETEIRAGFSNYQSNSGPDANCKIIDLDSPTYDKTDATHPSIAGQATLAALVTAEIEAQFGL